jgi:1A family penicillin-binding protein
MSENLQGTRMERKRKKPSVWKKIFAFFGILTAIAVLAIVIYLINIIGTLDDLDPGSLVNYEQTSLVFDSEGELISSIHGSKNRIYVPLNQIPKHVQDAFIAVEDVRFRSHPGFDIRRIFGSLLQNIKARDIVAGGGTITQQLVRNTVLSFEQSVDRKVKEILLAWQLEQRYSKDQILEMYLNVIYFAKGAYGIEAAAQTYFGKSVSELSVAEGALLVGIIKNPHRNSPFIDKDRALERKDLCIDLMVKNGYLTEEEGKAAKAEELIFAEDVKPAYTHGYFVDMVLEEAAEILGIKLEELYTGGYRIYTTLDRNLQEYAENLYAQDDYFPKSPVSGESCESALVVMDTQTGRIKALLGGRSYPEDQRYVLNRAEVKRSPGSTIKPLLVYIPAIELFNYTPVSFIEDEPIDIEGYIPSNADGKFRGMVTLRETVAKSINIPTVKIFHEIGISHGKTMAEKMGISFESGDNNLAIALGGMEKGVTPLEIARAYAAIGDRGSYKNYTTILRIDDSRGKTLYENHTIKEQVFSEETAFLVTSMLQSATDPEMGGTARRLNGLNLAAKTGTVQLPRTDEFRGIKGANDAWVAAYNPEYTVVVWMGFDKRSPENYLPSGTSGGNQPTIVAGNIFQYIYENKDKPKYEKPIGISEVKLDGKALKEQKRVLLATALTPKEYIVTEYFVKGTEPAQESDYWVIPNAPQDFRVALNEADQPVISFVPGNSFAGYYIMRITGQEEKAVLVHQVQTGSLDPVEWTDTQVTPGETYGYFIIPYHPEMKLDGEAVQGPQTQILNITIPEQETENGSDFWEDLWDLLRPGQRNQDGQDDDTGEDGGSSQDNEINENNEDNNGNGNNAGQEGLEIGYDQEFRRSALSSFPLYLPA